MSKRALRATLLVGCALNTLPVFAQEQQPYLVITANRIPQSIQQIGSSVTVISNEEIDKQGAKSLYDILLGQPGLQTVENGGPGGFVSVFMRGSEARHTLVLLDGVRLGDPTSTGNEIDLSLIPPANVERIEIIRGPQSALYGSDAIGGVINIITKKGQKGPPVWRHRVEGGSYGTMSSNLGVSGATQDTVYSLSVDQFHADGFKRYGYRIPRLSSINPSGSDPVNRYGTTARISKKLSDWLTFETGLQGSWSKIQFDGGDNSPLAPLTPNFQTAWQGSAYQKMIAENGPFRTTVSMFETRFVKNTRAKGTYLYDDGVNPPYPYTYHDRYDYRGTRLGSELQQDIDLGSKGIVSAGVRYEEEKSDSGTVRTHRQSTRSAYALYQISPVNKLNLSFGTRLDDVSTFGSFATWRATSSYALTSSTRLHSSIGTGAKAPSLYQLYDSYNGNSALKPEKSIGYDVGLEQIFLNGDARADVTWFSNHFSDMIDWAPTLNAWTGSYFNVNRARVSGTEFSAEYNLLPSFAKVKLAYTWLDTHIDANPLDPTDIDNGQRLLRRPRHTLRMSLPVTPTADWTVEPILRYVGSRADKVYDVNGNEMRVELKPYLRLDALASYKVSRNISFFMRAENLTNVKYENVYNYGTAGRSAYAGLQMTW